MEVYQVHDYTVIQNCMGTKQNKKENNKST